MLIAPVVHRLTVYPLTISLRRSVTHAAADRSVGDPVVVAVELMNGTVGYGETLPRAYVTGETVDAVISTIADVLVPALMDFHPASFPEALEALEALPRRSPTGSPIPAARCAVELALLDASMRYFQRDVDAVVQWMGLPGFGRPGSLSRIRYSGVLACKTGVSLLRRLRLMYWGGLRDFKLKVGLKGDLESVSVVARYLSGSLRKKSATLRLDANGCWSKDEAIDRLGGLADVPIAAVEQPLAKGNEQHLPILHDLFSIPLVHDESLVTLDDAMRLVGLGVADVFNIRISKCGGFLPSLRLAAFAKREGVRVQLGCMVSETSILSAAGLRFLEVCPGVDWAEGCFGLWLLRADVVEKSLRFGYGGRPPQLEGPGWGVSVNRDRLMALCPEPPRVIQL